MSNIVNLNAKHQFRVPQINERQSFLAKLIKHRPQNDSSEMIVSYTPGQIKPEFDVLDQEIATRLVEFANKTLGRKVCNGKSLYRKNIRFVSISTNADRKATAVAAVSEKNFLGKGSFGRVFAGWLLYEHTDGFWAMRDVAVKFYKSDQGFSRNRHAEEQIKGDFPYLNKSIGYGDKCLIQNLFTNGDAAGSMNRPEQEIVKILYGVAQGIKHLHDQNIVHRDIKPQNILVGPDGYGVLSDHDLVCNPTKPSADYLDPLNYINDKEVIKYGQDKPADIWSLAKTIEWFLAVKTDPFVDFKLEEDLEALQEEILKKSGHDDRMDIDVCIQRLSNLIILQDPLAA